MSDANRLDRGDQSPAGLLNPDSSAIERASAANSSSFLPTVNPKLIRVISSSFRFLGLVVGELDAPFRKLGVFGGKIHETVQLTLSHNRISLDED